MVSSRFTFFSLGLGFPAIFGPFLGLGFIGFIGFRVLIILRVMVF